MKLHELQVTPGSRHRQKRVGRGTGSGIGKTSTRGQKGQNSRSGGGVRPGFEGGQMPLTRRLPKRGFYNNFSKHYAIINVCELDVFENGTEINIDMLKEVGYIKKPLCGLKILGDGELTKKLTVKAAKFTESAKAKIEAAGGSAEVV